MAYELQDGTPRYNVALCHCGYIVSWRKAVGKVMQHRHLVVRGGPLIRSVSTIMFLFVSPTNTEGRRELVSDSLLVVESAHDSDWIERSIQIARQNQ